MKSLWMICIVGTFAWSQANASTKEQAIAYRQATRLQGNRRTLNLTSSDVHSSRSSVGGPIVSWIVTPEVPGIKGKFFLFEPMEGGGVTQIGELSVFPQRF